MDKETSSAATIPFEEARIDSGDGHRLWHAQHGSRDGIALFWLHGGPGSGASLRHAELIDGKRFRLVLADQRGCGRSEPAGEIRNNSLPMLIDDIESLRRLLGIDRMLLGGGSWGATLAICYAARHPDAVAGLVLRAPFLAEADEIARLFRPLDAPASAHDAGWHAFASLAPAGADLLAHAADRLTSNAADAADATALARAWHRHAQLRETGREPEGAALHDAALLARYRVQAHYLRHGCFLEEGAVLEMAGGLTMPTAIFHGDADRVCSPENARRLASRMPHAGLSLIEGAGHDPFHPGMATALRSALRSVAQRGDFQTWRECDATR